jgi:aminopeptidase-like protein
MATMEFSSRHQSENVGQEAFKLAQLIWDFPRTLAGPGFEKSLAAIENFIGDRINYLTFKSGEEVFDWNVPDYWEVIEAYISAPSGKKLCNFHENNLHLVGYSIPYEGDLSRSELEQHLHSIPSQPDAIPYVTAYYDNTWGFCISHNEKAALEDGVYRVVIRTRRTQGLMTIGEYVIDGEQSDKQILLSTYLCHPSMANNELSGPVLAASLAKHYKTKRLKRGLRILFLPETIGSIAYLSRNLENLKNRIFAGFVLTCVGDERSWSLLPSRTEKSLSEKVAKRILKEEGVEFKEYSWADRGSDERQYSAPGIDLPVASIMRSKYGTYAEYHNSLDTLGNVVTAQGLTDSYFMYSKVIDFLMRATIPQSKVLCEPNLGKRNLYPKISDGSALKSPSRKLLNFLSYCDGTNSLEDLAELVDIDVLTAQSFFGLLSQHGLVADI